LNAVAFTFRTEIAMPEARNADVPERGLLIGGKSVPCFRSSTWRCVQVLREAAAAITRPMGELLPTSIPGAYSMAQRIPYRVVGAMSPWNAPLVFGIRSIAIPLAVGNTVVMKPIEDAPITCGLLLDDVLTEAELPPGSSMSSPTTWLMTAT
jgi:acyl-CoA reductase-like NAD-dependent aldehyde dehydrogenase